MLSVNQHWDSLKVCAVGRSYPPEFYSYITNPRVRNVLEKIAIETEEDYQKLISLLESFGVSIVRPLIDDNFDFYKKENKFVPPPMVPRDYGGMIGSKFFWDETQICYYKNILDYIKQKGNEIFYQKKDHTFDTASVTRIGKDLYFGTINDTSVPLPTKLTNEIKQKMFSGKNVYNHFDFDTVETSQVSRIYEIINTSQKLLPDYRKHFLNTQGHSDGCFCPIVPGLIISLHDIQEYEKTFPNWEVIYLPNQSWSLVSSFEKIKEKNAGKWWVPGEELNDDFTDFVENWLSNWVGFVEETVFDVNMLVIDKKNVICNNYNKKVFDAFGKYGITPHIINFRHRYFWDGGLHCITLDLDREGVMEDYFPERSLNV